MEELMKKLELGEHIYINNYEIFMSYTGNIWIRRKMSKEEILRLGFEGTHQEYFNTLEQLLDKISYNYNKQLTFI